MGSAVPFRLDFFDDEIDSIRTFDVDTQRTLEEIQAINLLPAHEFPTDEKGIEFFRTQFRETFGEIRRDPEHIYQQVSKGTLISGIEYWQPLFFEQMASLFDYLPKNTLWLDVGDIQEQGTRFYQDAEQRYESRKVDPMRPLLPPDRLWLRLEEINRILKSNIQESVSNWIKFVHRHVKRTLPCNLYPHSLFNRNTKNHYSNYVNLVSNLRARLCFRWKAKGAVKPYWIYSRHSK